METRLINLETLVTCEKSFLWVEENTDSSLQRALGCLTWKDRTKVPEPTNQNLLQC